MKDLTKKQLDLLFKAVIQMEDKIFMDNLHNKNKSENIMNLEIELKELSTIVFTEKNK